MEHASPWRAARAVPVDLHRRIPHLPADPELVWRTLTEDPDVVTVASEEVEVVGIRALPLIVALHALHHGLSQPKPLKDLTLAAQRLPLPAWRDSRDLAVALGAERNLAAALSLTPASRTMASTLDLPRLRRWEIALRSGDPARLASAFRLLRESHGIRRKVAALRDELLPEEDMRGRTRGAAGESSPARVLTRRFFLVLMAGPGAFVAWLLERGDVRRFNGRRQRASSGKAAG